MFQKMSLNDESFQLIKVDKKTIELRLNDKKRRKIQIGDLICFTNLKTKEELFVQVVNLYNFESFFKLYQTLDLRKCGYDDLKSAKHEDMLKYYSLKEQEKYGVLGIEIERLNVLKEPIKEICKTLTDQEITLKLNAISAPDKLKGYVLAYKYDIYLYNTNTKIGFIDIRLGFNENIIYGGNIGYMIHEQYRGNAYAKKASLLIFEVARSFQMNKLFISCSPNNLASKKTIENLGFKLIRKVTLPSYNEMYLLGDREKLVFSLTLEEKLIPIL